MTSTGFDVPIAIRPCESSEHAAVTHEPRRRGRSAARRCAVALLAAVALWQARALAAVQGPATTPAPDEAQVVAVVETMYRAAVADDLDLFHSVAAPEFYAFDNGKRFDGDALMELIKSLHAAGKVYVWRVTEPQVLVFGDTALVTFVNRGSITDASGTKDHAWLESALLRRDGGRWRIRFFHSTRVQ